MSEISPGQISEVVGFIRAESAAARLVTASALQTRFPETDIPALLAQADAPDIEVLDGTSTVYYFSTQGMTRAYAIHLARLEERDPRRLVAGLVRDNARIYPRPTALAIFREAPYRIAEEDLALILARESAAEGAVGEDADIRSLTTSNGAVYLYSTRYLSPEHAQGLAEWEAVGAQENP